MSIFINLIVRTQFRIPYSFLHMQISYSIQTELSTHWQFQRNVSACQEFIMQKRISELNLMQTFAFSKHLNLKQRKGSAKFRKLIEAEIDASPEIVSLLAHCCYFTNITESRKASGDFSVQKSVPTYTFTSTAANETEQNTKKRVMRNKPDEIFQQSSEYPPLFTYRSKRFEIPTRLCYLATARPNHN